MNDIKLIVTLLVFAGIGGCTTGSATVLTGWESSPIDVVAVTLYDEPPPNYEVVGSVKAESIVFLFFMKRKRKSVRLLNLRNKLQQSVPTA